MAGYSGTPLPKKLGIKDNHTLLLLAAPTAVAKALQPLPTGVQLRTTLRAKGPFDVIVLFTKSRAELLQRFSALVHRLDPAGGLWIAWPKKASRVITDMTEDEVRAVALPRGLVDNKVCAIDETWSGLRCVIRKEFRPKSVTRR